MSAMRWAGLIAVLAVLGLGVLAYVRPNLLPLGDIDVPRLIYLLLALLLVAGAGAGFRRLQVDRGRLLWAALFWAGLILTIMALYNLFN